MISPLLEQSRSENSFCTRARAEWRTAGFELPVTKNCGGNNYDRGTSENDTLQASFRIRFTPPVSAKDCVAQAILDWVKSPYAESDNAVKEEEFKTATAG